VRLRVATAGYPKHFPQGLTWKSTPLTCNFAFIIIIRVGTRAFVEILLHTPYTRRITFALGFARRYRPQSCFVMDKRARGRMKGFSIFRNHDHYFSGNADPGLCMFRTQLGTDERRGVAHLETYDNQKRRCHRDHPPKSRSSLTRHIFLQPSVETLAESLRWLEHTFLSVEADHVARALKYRAAFLAPAQVLIHGGAQIWGDFAVEVIRNLQPNLLAGHYHGLVPLANDNLLLQLPPSPGASRSRSMSRARSNRVFTDAVETPESSRSFLNAQMLHIAQHKTSRYFCPSDANASASFCRTSLRSRVSDGISRQSAKSRGT
jgi:hypothetical protein